MDPHRPPVSVIIPTYNRAGFLGRSIESALGQTVSPAEIIVVDDGSTDETESVCRRFGSDVTYVRQENAGAAVARNRGLEMANGALVAFLDSDDYWLPSKLQAQVEALDRLPEVGWALTDFHVVDLEGSTRDGTQGFARQFPVFRDLGVEPDEFFGRALVSDTMTLADRDHRVFHGDAFGLLFHGNFAQPTGALIRREAIREVGPFDPAMRVAQDTEFFHRLAARSDVAIILSPLYAWTVGHEASNVTPANTIALIENALTSLERAASLRGSLTPEQRAAFESGRARQLCKLAYARLTAYQPKDARAAARSALRAAAPGTSRWFRAIALWLATLGPRWLLRALGAVKRSISTTGRRGRGTGRPSRRG